MSQALLSILLSLVLSSAMTTHHASFQRVIPNDDPVKGAGYGVLSGKITGTDGRPANGVAVELVATSPKLGGYSRTDGTYRIPRLRPGTYTVVAHRTPAATSDTMTIQILPGATATLDISIRERFDVATLGDRDRAAVLARTEGGIVTMDEAPLAIGAPPPPPPAGGIIADHESRVMAADARMTMTTTAPSKKGSGASLRGGRASEKSVSFSGKSASRARTDGSVALSTKDGRKDGAIRISSDTTTDVAEVKRTPGQLTAGEWIDLDNWGYWTDVASSPDWSPMVTRWKFDPSTRVSVRLVDGGKPVVDGEVRLVDDAGKVLWNARTDNRGRAELFAGVDGAMGQYRVEVKSRGLFIDAGSVRAGQSEPLVVRQPGAATVRNEFDLMFMVDATGSMGDEMEYIKSELENVIERNRESASEELKVRLSCNVYRDVGDDYVVRSFPFSESTFEMIGHLRAQSADGGGDTPEAVEEALEDAIEKHEWSAQARARLLFLVLDAPPHYTPDRVAKLRKLAIRAAEKGIRIIPIASSGVDKETEFLLRLLAIHSQGTYVFLTDDSGIGNAHIKPTIGQYRVEYLNDLLVRVIGRYLANEQSTVDGGNGLDLR